MALPPLGGGESLGLSPQEPVQLLMAAPQVFWAAACDCDRTVIPSQCTIACLSEATFFPKDCVLESS